MGTPEITSRYSSLIEIRYNSVDWIHLAPDRDKWQAVVNTVINLRVPQNAENFSTS
jgi:hypothetical protein